MKSTQLSLSAVVLTRNESSNIDACLRSLRFCEEIVVIDDYSTDNTLTTAHTYKARVYQHRLNNNFAQQRNFGLTKARGEWVLFIDADERVPKNLAKEIRNTINKNTKNSGYFIRRIDMLWGREITHGEMSPYGKFGNGYILRLARKDSGKWSRHIHEQWNVTGSTSTLLSQLIHLPHQTLFEFLYDVSKRAQIHAHSLKREGKTARFSKILVWPVGKFIYNYIFKLGFLDGIEGFILAIVMSFHSFISWSYLWLIQK